MQIANENSSLYNTVGPDSTTYYLSFSRPSMMQRSLLLLLSLQASYCLAFSTQSPFKVVSRAQLDLGHDNGGHRSSSSVALSSSTNNGGGDDSPFDNFLQSIFSSPSSAAVAKPEAIPDFVVDSDYKIAVLLIISRSYRGRPWDQSTQVNTTATWF